MGRAGIYCRISQDRGGAGLGVARQEDDCRALCDRLGWSVVDVYVDNDTSAYSGKPRPAWNRLNEDVRTGAIDAIAVWHVDRLTRRPVELEHVIDMANTHGLALATVTGEVDLSTSTGRLVARIVGATARQEVEHKADKQKRQREQAARAGKPNGGGTRPYGYEADFVTVIETEAGVIREWARRVLAGESLSSIARDLDARGVETPKGGRWQVRTLQRMLASARISGRREHKPRASGNNGTRPLVGEIVADAQWPAIISSEDSDRLRSLLSDPNRRPSTATGRRYLLSGILRCGLCGGKMCGRPRAGVPRYVCPNMPGGNTCGRIATNAAHTDEHVRDRVLTALASPELAARLRHSDAVPPERLASIRADEAQLEELSAAWANRELSRGEWKIAREIIEVRLDRNRPRLPRSSAVAPLADLVGTYDDLLDRWEQMNVSQRRAVAVAVLDRVDVGPSNPRKRWDPERFELRWRT